MTQYKTILIDDEPLARLGLRNLLEKINDKNIHVIAEASNGLEALEVIQENAPDLLFLDIQMPGLNGFELLQQLSRIPLVIFTTAYDHFALKAFETHAIDYLLKPIKPEHLQRALSKLESFRDTLNGLGFISNPKERPENDFKQYLRQFAVKCGTKWEIVPEEEVISFYSKEKFSYIKTAMGEKIIDQSLQNLEKKLDPEKFIRVHRSMIISLKQVRNYQSLGSSRLKIMLKDGTIVKSSRSFSREFKQCFDTD